MTPTPEPDPGVPDPDPAVGATAPPAPPPTLRRSPVRRSLGRLALVTTCALAGLSASLVARAVANRAAGPDAAPVAPHADAPKPEPAPHEVPVDVLIRAARFDEALKHLRTPHTAQAPSGHLVAYREGLCFEALDQWDAADDAYRRAGDSRGDQGAWARAALGRARVALGRGDAGAAADLADQAFLRAGHPHCRGGHIAEECAYVRARLALAALEPPRWPDPFDSGSLAWVPLGERLDGYLDWLPFDHLSAGPPHPGGEHGPRDAVAVDGTDGRRTLTAHLRGKPLKLVEAIGAGAGLAVRAEGDAGQLLSKDDVSIDVEGAPLSEAVAALAGPLGVSARVEGDTLVLSPVRPPTDKAEHARAAVRRALDLAPRHPDARGLRVALANLDASARAPREAAAAYRQFLETEPHAPEAQHAAYNLALNELRGSNFGQARGRFLEVIDRGPTTRWACLAWWWIGRSHLDTGDTSAARRVFRTVSAGRHRAAADAAALGACACELLDGNDAEARALVRERRAGVAEAAVSVWNLFERHMQYRVGASESRRENLARAVLAADEGRGLGYAGVFLAGAAYRDAGHADRMAALFEQAAGATRGPLAARMSFHAAAWHDEHGRPDRARQRYLVVAATDPEGLGPRAELRVAQLAADGGAGGECVARCRRLLDRPGVDRAEVLATLGRGYEALRRYRQAAECFAGHVPAE
ncbi:hypothetical protein : : TPR_6 [Gemmataceae bacterium]|nr:hypothetical protein : : TPR_6 [Gemmataceae bacterium]VTT97874.1 hypothetical protein : : TPR_6 [Gemmataceae bacterium]